MTKQTKRSWRSVSLLEIIDSLSYLNLVLLAVGTLLVFALLYYLLSIYSPVNGLKFPSNEATFWDSLYFSCAIFSTLGSSNIIPLGLSKFFSVVEVFSGLLTMGLIVSKIVSSSQRRILDHLIKGSYIGMLRDIRHSIANQRVRLINLSLKALQDPKAPRTIEEFEYYVRRTKHNYFRIVDSLFNKLVRYLQTEKNKNSILFNDFPVHYFEKIAQCVHSTVYHLNKSLNRFGHARYNWKNARTKEQLKKLLKSCIALIYFLDEHFKTEIISQRKEDIDKIISHIRQKHL